MTVRENLRLRVPVFGDEELPDANMRDDEQLPDANDDLDEITTIQAIKDILPIVPPVASAMALFFINDLSPEFAIRVFIVLVASSLHAAYQINQLKQREIGAEKRRMEIRPHLKPTAENVFPTGRQLITTPLAMIGLFGPRVIMKAELVESITMRQFLFVIISVSSLTLGLELLISSYNQFQKKPEENNQPHAHPRAGR